MAKNKIVIVEQTVTRDEVLNIIDSCFHFYASEYRSDAKEMAEEMLDNLEKVMKM